MTEKRHERTNEEEWGERTEIDKKKETEKERSKEKTKRSLVGCSGTLAEERACRERIRRQGRREEEEERNCHLEMRS